MFSVLASWHRSLQILWSQELQELMLKLQPVSVTAVILWSTHSTDLFLNCYC